MVKCMHCGEETDSTKKFCVHCGKRLNYFEKDRKEEVLKEKNDLEKERDNIKKEREKLNRERNKIFREKKELDRQNELNAKEKKRSNYSNNKQRSKSYNSKLKQTYTDKKQPGFLTRLKNKIVRLGIISITLLIILVVIAGALTVTGYLSYDGESISLSNPNDDSNLESISDSNSQSESSSLSESDNLLSLGSTKNVNFNDLFTMDIDKHRDFEDVTDITMDDCEKCWYSYEDVSKNEQPIQVYYWLNKKDYNFSPLSNYDGPEKDGNLQIFTFKYQYSEPQGCEYFVFVGDDDETVAIEGADLNQLKNYANSVKFKN